MHWVQALHQLAPVQERYYDDKLRINAKDPAARRKVVEDFIQASCCILSGICPGVLPSLRSPQLLACSAIATRSVCSAMCAGPSNDVLVLLSGS